MRATVRLFPVLYACQGCARFGQAARDAGAILERRGVVELVWLGGLGNAAMPKSRYPILALDGCDEACARRWLEQRGVTPERSYVSATAEELARELA